MGRQGTPDPHNWQLLERRYDAGAPHSERERIEQCAVCGARRRIMPVASGTWQVLESDPDPLPDNCNPHRIARASR